MEQDRFDLVEEIGNVGALLEDETRTAAWKSGVATGPSGPSGGGFGGGGGEDQYDEDERLARMLAAQYGDPGLDEAPPPMSSQAQPPPQPQSQRSLTPPTQSTQPAPAPISASPPVQSQQQQQQQQQQRQLSREVTGSSAGPPTMSSPGAGVGGGLGPLAASVGPPVASPAGSQRSPDLTAMRRQQQEQEEEARRRQQEEAVAEEQRRQSAEAEQQASWVEEQRLRLQEQMRLEHEENLRIERERKEQEKRELEERKKEMEEEAKKRRQADAKATLQSALAPGSREDPSVVEWALVEARQAGLEETDPALIREAESRLGQERGEQGRQNAIQSLEEAVQYTKKSKEEGDTSGRSIQALRTALEQSRGAGVDRENATLKTAEQLLQEEETRYINPSTSSQREAVAQADLAQRLAQEQEAQATIDLQAVQAARADLDEKISSGADAETLRASIIAAHGVGVDTGVLQEALATADKRCRAQDLAVCAIAERDAAGLREALRENEAAGGPKSQVEALRKMVKKVDKAEAAMEERRKRNAPMSERGASISLPMPPATPTKPKSKWVLGGSGAALAPTAVDRFFEVQASRNVSPQSRSGRPAIGGHFPGGSGARFQASESLRPTAPEEEDEASERANGNHFVESSSMLRQQQQQQHQHHQQHHQQTKQQQQLQQQRQPHEQHQQQANSLNDSTCSWNPLGSWFWTPCKQATTGARNPNSEQVEGNSDDTWCKSNGHCPFDSPPPNAELVVPVGAVRAPELLLGNNTIPDFWGASRRGPNPYVEPDGASKNVASALVQGQPPYEGEFSYLARHQPGTLLNQPPMSRIPAAQRHLLPEYDFPHTVHFNPLPPGARYYENPQFWKF